MEFIVNNLGKFKRGQFDITDECKSKSETGKVISINDGDVTTYVYEKYEYFKLDDLRSFVTESFCDGYGSYLATYKEDEDGNIFVFFEGSVDGIVDNIETICFYDENEDEEFFEIFTGDKNELLATSAFLSIDEVLINYPYLTYKK